MAGEFAHIEIPTANTAEAREFWGGLFGWRFDQIPGPFEYHMTRIGDRQSAAITASHPDDRGTRTYFFVEDIQASVARVREQGGRADDPAPVPGMGWFATCEDPHGNAFGLWQADPSVAS